MFLNSLKTSKRDAAVLQVPNNFVVAKKPLPLEPHTIQQTLSAWATSFSTTR
jgi:hypothetical protein